MKKALTGIVTLCILLGLVGCNASGGNSSYNDISDDSFSFTYSSTTKIEYISDRRVQYDSTNKYHIVFFGLQDGEDNYQSASGVASIQITDESNTTLYNKDISFSATDFTDWTNQQWDSSRYLCGLYIKDSELQGSASSAGTLSLKVKLSDGTYFDAKSLYISDLPSLSVKVSLPKIPANVTDRTFSSYISVAKITKLEYTSKVNSDGKATLYFDIIFKLISKTDNQNVSSRVAIGYKLYDSDGIVVDSGQIYSDPISVGESSKDDFAIYDLDPRDTYKLVFVDAT